MGFGEALQGMEMGATVGGIFAGEQGGGRQRASESVRPRRCWPRAGRAGPPPRGQASGLDGVPPTGRPSPLVDPTDLTVRAALLLA